MSQASTTLVEEVVLDTNVLLDWLVFKDPAAGPLVEALEAGRLRWIATRPMWVEWAEVLRRPFVAARSPLAEQALGRAEAFVERVEMPDQPGLGLLRCADPDDQMFIELALARPTRWLISRDKALLQLAVPARRLHLRIVRPDQWAALANAPDPPTHAA